ncbi:hypothetical protein GL4_1509 [Methyloceanibacter caenitepidi]|uniref:Uncharacterized protein n=2 Tax=Methyloceanibacter caenitepidi TaxID=1384459 RepID=A0A0A8K238_9HYPH|nr:hypothetical protein GL4_1509 [Methyloceanibacter caenitepidi]
MQLAQRMGQGWEPDVWENLGWHYAVVNGPFKITFDERSQRYEAEYTLEANDGFVFQVFTDADLPEDAFGFAVQEIRTRLVRIEQSLREVGGEQ